MGVLMAPVETIVSFAIATAAVAEKAAIRQTDRQTDCQIEGIVGSTTEIDTSSKP
ncbi:MAG: hypothetical protein AAFY72_11005 [Cyanobacteria bacterium J06649_4]